MISLAPSKIARSATRLKWVCAPASFGATAKGAMTHGLAAIGICEQVEAAGMANIAEAMLSARNRLIEMLVGGRKWYSPIPVSGISLAWGLLRPDTH